jgi:hypothetical protein
MYCSKNTILKSKYEASRGERGIGTRWVLVRTSILKLQEVKHNSTSQGNVAEASKN